MNSIRRMIGGLTLTLTMVAAPALAQSPVGLPGMSLNQTIAPNQRFLTDAVQSHRFQGDTSVNGPNLAAGDQVVLVHTVGDKARIMKGTQYGWVDSSLLSETKPEVAAPSGGLLNPNLGNLGNMKLNLPNLGEGLKPPGVIGGMKAPAPVPAPAN